MAAAVGPSSRRLFYISDRVSRQRYLVDTDAAVSVIPARRHDKRSSPANTILAAANGATISTFGKRSVHLQFHARRYVWDFIVARVTQPLLGADFLCHYGLLVDVRNERLLDIHSYSSLTLQVADDATPVLSSVATSGPFSALLSEFHDLVTPTFHTNTIKNDVEHFIPTTGPPVHSRFRRLKPDKLQIAKDEFTKMESLGIIRRSNSPWSSPSHMVPKNSGGWRPCGDYRRLNDATIPDRYPIPHIQDCSANLADARVFSKIDLVCGYLKCQSILPMSARPLLSHLLTFLNSYACLLV